MTITAIGFVPSAPLLVPEVAGGSAGRDEPLRDACRDVVRGLLATRPAVIRVLAPWSSWGEWKQETPWDFSGFGVGSAADEALPWPLGIGAWLLDDVGYGGERVYVGIEPDMPGIVGEPSVDAAVLVVGDGSARRTEKAPGHFDPRAEAFDAAVAAALESGRPSELADMNLGLAADLMCNGARVWRFVGSGLPADSSWEARLLGKTAEYGVGYFVALWTRIQSR